MILFKASILLTLLIFITVYILVQDVKEAYLLFSEIYRHKKGE